MDTAIIRHEQLFKLLLEGNHAKVAYWMTRYPTFDWLRVNAPCLDVAVQSITLLSRCAQPFAERMFTGLPCTYRFAGWNGDYAPILKILEQQGVQGPHAIITGRFAALANIAAYVRANYTQCVVAIGNTAGNKDLLGSQEDRQSAWPHRWLVVARSDDQERLRAGIAIDHNVHPIFAGVPDHGTHYFADYAYHSLKQHGLHYGSWTKNVFAFKEETKQGRDHPFVRELLDGQEIPFQPSEPFVIIPLPSSDAGAPSSRWPATVFADYLATRSQGLGRVVTGLTRRTAIDTKANDGENDRVECHLESLEIANVDEIKGKHILLCDDVVTKFTQSEAASCLLRMRVDPLSITRVALMRTVNGSRRTTAADTIIAEEIAAGRRNQLPARRMILPLEPCPFIYDNFRFRY